MKKTIDYAKRKKTNKITLIVTASIIVLFILLVNLLGSDVEQNNYHKDLRSNAFSAAKLAIEKGVNYPESVAYGDYYSIKQDSATYRLKVEFSAKNAFGMTSEHIALVVMRYRGGEPYNRRESWECMHITFE